GISFLIEQFRDTGLADPGDPNHGLDLHKLAAAYAERYGQYKADKKNRGSIDVQKIPCVNHPVFKDKPVNHDPREVFIGNLHAEHVAFRAARVVSAFGQCTMRSPKRNQAPVEADDGLWIAAEQVDITSRRIVGEA